MPARSLSCIAHCLVEGRRYIKRFHLAVALDEDDAVTLSRALRRARELLSFEHGVTDEVVLVERVAYA